MHGSKDYPSVVMSTTLPYRIQPCVVDVRSSTESDGSRQPLMTTENFITRIKRTPYPIELSAICAHPDERVPIAAIERWGHTLPLDTKTQLLARGELTCIREGIVWHPLLDALATYKSWPSYSNSSDSRVSPDGRSIEHHLQPLAVWLEKQTDPGVIKPLLQFRAREVWELVGRHAGVITKDLLAQLPPHSLAQNPHLGDDFAAILVERAIDLIASYPKPLSQLIPDIRHLGLLSLIPTSSLSVPGYSVKDLQASAVLALRTLVQAGHSVSEDFVQRILGALRENPQASYFISALNALGPHVAADHLVLMFQYTPPHLWHQFIRHPAITPELQLSALRRIPRKASTASMNLLYDELSQDARALTHPEIRRAILQSDSVSSLTQALDTATSLDGEAFFEVLQGLVVRRPFYAAKLFCDRTIISADTGIWVDRVRKECLDEFIHEVVKTNDLRALEMLLNDSVAALDPRLQEAALAHPDATEMTFSAVAAHARGELFRRMFGQLCNKFGPETIYPFLQSLLQNPPPGLADLQPNDIAPLLESSHRQIRLQAIALLAYTSNHAEEPEKQAMDSRARSYDSHKAAW